MNKRVIFLFVSFFLLLGCGVAYSQVSRIVISEFLPNPAGSDRAGEWIELHNLSDSKIDISGWFVEDKSYHKEFVKKGSFIEGGGFFLLGPPLKNLSINNNGETLTLFDNKGREVFKIEFNGRAKEGESFARKEIGDWQWTKKLTPGKANDFSLTDNSLNSAFADKTKKEGQKEDQEGRLLKSSFLSLSFWNLLLIGLSTSFILSILFAYFLNRIE